MFLASILHVLAENPLYSAKLHTSRLQAFPMFHNKSPLGKYKESLLLIFCRKPLYFKKLLTILACFCKKHLYSLKLHSSSLPIFFFWAYFAINSLNLRKSCIDPYVAHLLKTLVHQQIAFKSLTLYSFMQKIPSHSIHKSLTIFLTNFAINPIVLGNDTYTLLNVLIKNKK